MGQNAVILVVRSLGAGLNSSTSDRAGERTRTTRRAPPIRRQTLGAHAHIVGGTRRFPSTLDPASPALRSHHTPQQQVMVNVPRSPTQVCRWRSSTPPSGTIRRFRSFRSVDVSPNRSTLDPRPRPPSALRHARLSTAFRRPPPSPKRPHPPCLMAFAPPHPLTVFDSGRRKEDLGPLPGSSERCHTAREASDP